MKNSKLLLNILFIVLFKLSLLNIFTNYSKASTVFTCIEKQYPDGTTGVVIDPPVKGFRVGKFDFGSFLQDSCLIPKSTGRFIGFYSGQEFVPYNLEGRNNPYDTGRAHYSIRIVEDPSTGQVYYSVPLNGRFVLD